MPKLENTFNWKKESSKNVDLSNYYTKKEVDNNFLNKNNGGYITKWISTPEYWFLKDGNSSPLGFALKDNNIILKTYKSDLEITDNNALTTKKYVDDKIQEVANNQPSLGDIINCNYLNVNTSLTTPLISSNNSNIRVSKSLFYDGNITQTGNYIPGIQEVQEKISDSLYLIFPANYCFLTTNYYDMMHPIGNLYNSNGELISIEDENYFPKAVGTIQVGSERLTAYKVKQNVYKKIGG